MTKKLMMAMLSLAFVGVLICAPLEPAVAQSKYKEVKIEFDASGNMSKLEIEYRDGAGNLHIVEFHEDQGDPDGTGFADHDVLWGGSNTIEFIKNDNCVLIDGGRYCFPD